MKFHIESNRRGKKTFDLPSIPVRQLENGHLDINGALAALYFENEKLKRRVSALENGMERLIKDLYPDQFVEAMGGERQFKNN